MARGHKSNFSKRNEGYTVAQNHALDPYSNKDTTYSDAYGSGYNYNPQTSALSAQSSYTSMAFYAPPTTSNNTYIVDPYGPEFNEGWGVPGATSTLGKDNSFGEDSRAAMASSSSWGTRQYSSSVYQPPPPGTTSLSHYPPPNRNNKLNSESLDEPLPEPIPSSPSPSYLSMSSQPSTRLSNPGDARKLIILDLNGTLLYRAPPKSRDLYPRKRGRGGANAPTAAGIRDRTKDDVVFEKDEFGRDMPRSRPPSLMFEKDELGRDIPRSQPLPPVPERDEFGRDIPRASLASHVDPSATRNISQQPEEPWDFYKDPRYIVTRPLRTVYARPYIPSFRKYLFHPETRKWLDVMVWSSAQPHSVEDMVGRVFGVSQESSDGVEKRENVDAGMQEEREGEKKNSGLIAVWARDTLGLNKAAYNSKSQTTKNLDKPWEQLTPLIPGNETFSTEEMQRAREMLDIQANQQEEEEESMSAEETEGISTLPNSETSSTIATANATPSSDEPFTSVPTSPDPNPNPPPSSDPSTPELHGQPEPNTVSRPAFDAAQGSHLHSHSDSGHHRRPYLHSAQTTLLLDDSPLKARLQPWNHFCVPEYSREVWLRDGKVVAPPPPPSSLNEPTPSGFGSAPVESTPSLEAETDGGPKREVEGALGSDKGQEGDKDTNNEESKNVPFQNINENPNDHSDGDDDIQLQLELDTSSISIDTSLVPTVPNSPIRNKKRKRTDTDLGSASLASLGGSGVVGDILVGVAGDEGGLNREEGDIPGLSNTGLGLFGHEQEGPTAGDDGGVARPGLTQQIPSKLQPLSLTKSRLSQLSDMSISTGSVGSARSMRTVDTEIVDSMGNPIDGGNRREPESHMVISGSGKDGHGGIPTSSLPIPSGGYGNDAPSYMTSGSIGGAEKHTSSEVNAGRNVDENEKRTPRKYDETILAVIGILDAIKWQSNVAGWMKAKGVFRWKLAQSGDEREEEEGKDVAKQQLEEGEGASTVTVPGKQHENIKKGGDERKKLGYEDDDEDDEELEKLYEKNVIKSLEDSAQTHTNDTPFSPFNALGVGAGGGKKRWRKKRKVDVGLGKDGTGGGGMGMASSSTAAPGVTPAFVDVDVGMSQVNAPEPTSKEISSSEAPAAAAGGAPELAETETDKSDHDKSQQPPASTSEEPPVLPVPNSTSISPGLDSTVDNPDPSLLESSEPSTGGTNDNEDEDEIPGLGQFVFHGNSPPPEGAQIIDVDTMDISEIAANRHNAPVHSLHDLDHLDPNRWFQYRDVRSHWVRRGKKALRELGIEIEAGVTGVLL